MSTLFGTILTVETMVMISSDRFCDVLWQAATNLQPRSDGTSTCSGLAVLSSSYASRITQLDTWQIIRVKASFISICRGSRSETNECKARVCTDITVSRVKLALRWSIAALYRNCNKINNMAIAEQRRHSSKRSYYFSIHCLLPSRTQHSNVTAII